MRATPDLPDSMTPSSSGRPLQRLAALLAQAATYDRISDAEWTFESLKGECIRRQAQLAHLYGVKP